MVAGTELAEMIFSISITAWRLASGYLENFRVEPRAIKWLRLSDNRYFIRPGRLQWNRISVPKRKELSCSMSILLTSVSGNFLQTSSFISASFCLSLPIPKTVWLPFASSLNSVRPGSDVTPITVILLDKLQPVFRMLAAMPAMVISSAFFTFSFLPSCRYREISSI